MAVPDRLNIDKVALGLTVQVALTKTVRPGWPVKISASQPDANILAVEECALNTDKAIGVARGILGDTPFAASAKFQITAFFHVVERAMAGTGGVTVGARVSLDTAGTPLGLITAPAFAAGGATEVWCPGIALNAVAVNEAFGLAIMPHTITAT